jgi:hypothetical protein
MIDSYRKMCLDAFKYFSFNKKVFPAQVEFIENKKVLKLKKKITKEIPLILTDYVSRLPYFGSP